MGKGTESLHSLVLPESFDELIMAGQPTPTLTYPPPRNKASLRAY